MSIYSLLVVLLGSMAAVPCQAFTSVASALHSAPITVTPPYRSSTHRLHSSSPIQNQNVPSDVPPPPPELKRTPLPVMLAGGLFLFATSVSPSQKNFANRLLALSEEALRTDPTVVMELGTGIEAGGVYASSSGTAVYAGNTVDQLILQFQINGGNAWAQGVAYGIVPSGQQGEATLLNLEVANMDAVLNGQSFQIPLKQISDDTNKAGADD
mmetsp:Transcript_45289/g.95018  ORF Transcript_45289/g.95018 Transcript_45289/m.95018 type:complete len:212 (+) Transcript_45289:97-732(+)